MRVRRKCGVASRRLSFGTGDRWDTFVVRAIRSTIENYTVTYRLSFG